MKNKNYFFMSLPLIVLSACNSGTTSSTPQNNVQLSSKIAQQNTNTASILSQINRLKSVDSIKIGYTLDGQAFNTGTLNWSDIGWHLLTLTVTAVPTNASPVAVEGVLGTIGDGTNPPQYGETVSIKDINCSTATFSKVGDTCSAYVMANYNYTQYPNVNPLIVVNLYPGNWRNLPDSIQPKDNVTSQTTVGIYRPISEFESQYYSGSTVKANPNQYRMLLMENSNINSININNILPLTNSEFTQLHRTNSSANDPIYGSWSECSLTANANLNQIATLPSLNSSCILVYQAESTSATPTQTANVTVATNAVSVFPEHAGSYTLQANYSGSVLNGISWQGTTLPSAPNGYVALTTDGNGKFVAIANNSNTAAYSMNGENWQASTLPISDSWSSVAYGNGTFVAVAYDGKAIYSTDGINWQTSTLPTIGNMSNVVFGNGMFIVSGCNPRVRMMCGSFEEHSPDGINWTSSGDANGAGYYAYGNGKFVEIFTASFGGSSYNYSSDGINWQSIPSMPSGSWNKAFYANGIFFVTDDGSTTAYSTDGINWQTMSIPNSPSNIAYGNGIFIGVNSEGTGGAYSLNGTNWQASTSSNYSLIAYDNISNNFVAIGNTGNGAVGTVTASLNNFNSFSIVQN